MTLWAWAPRRGSARSAGVDLWVLLPGLVQGRGLEVLPTGVGPDCAQAAAAPRESRTTAMVRGFMTFLLAPGIGARSGAAYHIKRSPRVYTSVILCYKMTAEPYSHNNRDGCFRSLDQEETDMLRWTVACVCLLLVITPSALLRRPRRLGPLPGDHRGRSGRTRPHDLPARGLVIQLTEPLPVLAWGTAAAPLSQMHALSWSKWPPTAWSSPSALP